MCEWGLSVCPRVRFDWSITYEIGCLSNTDEELWPSVQQMSLNECIYMDKSPFRYWCFCLSMETWSLKLNPLPNFEKLEYFVFAVTLSSPAISSWGISGSCCCYGTTISWHILIITYIPSSCANEMHQQKLTYIIRKHAIDTWIRFVCLVILFIVGFKYVWYLYSQTLDISGTLA